MPDPDDIIATTKAGAVRGLRRDGIARDLGVPYADSPTGIHRFAAPRPLTPWSGVRGAGVHGASAEHPPFPVGLPPEPQNDGDNCLNLNVYPPVHADGPRPVLVWIHGGGFVTGGNASPWYRGDAFARHGLVFVAINYRLGPEGFMVLDDAPSNRAILDMVAALSWVKESIRAFGGDPTNETVAGQSAGATSCLTLSGCPGAHGLFRRVVVLIPADPVPRTVWSVGPAPPRAVMRARTS